MASKQSTYSLTLIAYLVIGILVLAVGFFGWHGQNTEHNKLVAQQEALLRQTDENQRLTAGKPKLEARQTALTTTLNQIDQNLVAYDYIPTYLQQLQQAARATGNSIQSIQPNEIKPLDLKRSPLAPPSSAARAAGSTNVVVTEVAAGENVAADADNGPEYQTQQFNIEVRGTYVSTLRFLAALRKFRKLVYVRALTLTPLGGDGPQGILNVHLETYAIILPEQYKPVPVKAATTAGKAQQ